LMKMAHSDDKGASDGGDAKPVNAAVARTAADKENAEAPKPWKAPAKAQGLQVAHAKPVSFKANTKGAAMVFSPGKRPPSLMHSALCRDPQAAALRDKNVGDEMCSPFSCCLLHLRSSGPGQTVAPPVDEPRRRTGTVLHFSPGRCCGCVMWITAAVVEDYGCRQTTVDLVVVARKLTVCKPRVP